MNNNLASDPAIQALKNEFGKELRVEGDDPKTLKNCIYVRLEDAGDRQRLVIQALGANGKPVEFNESQRDKLVRVKPELEVQFGRSGETQRRAQALKSITSSLEQKPHIFAIESLDPSKPYVNPEHFDASRTSTLPEMLTWIDASDPEKPVRKFLLIEQNVGGVGDNAEKTQRVDHVLVQYEMDKTEVDALKQQDGSYKNKFLDYIEQVKGSKAKIIMHNLKVKLTDPNRFIHASAAARHFNKSIESALSVVDFFVREFNGNPIGNVYLRMIDIFQNPTEVRDERIAKRSVQGRPKTMKTVAEAVIKVDYDQRGDRIGYTALKTELVEKLSTLKVKQIRSIELKLLSLSRTVSSASKALRSSTKRTKRGR